MAERLAGGSKFYSRVSQVLPKLAGIQCLARALALAAREARAHDAWLDGDGFVGRDVLNVTEKKGAIRAVRGDNSA